MKLKTVLDEQLNQIQLEKEVFKKISETANNFVKQLQNKLSKKGIAAEVFIGGSLAKNTLVKKDTYDADIFVRFDEKYDDSRISKILGKILSRKAKKLHGSRDYYQLNIDGILIEVVPVTKIKQPEDARNVTDLSYFHVNYVLGKNKKNKKLKNEIILAKAFCHAQNAYGAEGYVKGFSGYSIELLICHYGSFEKFLQAIQKLKPDEKIIIDDAKFYKKNNVLQELNNAKLQSPIILIDPTYKQRNALAGLSNERLNKFKTVAKKFLQNPGSEFFVKKGILKDLKEKYKEKLEILVVQTNRQAGDISGTKSKKFFEFFKYKLKREFVILEAEFEYSEEKNYAGFYFVVNKKKDETIKGPSLKDTQNVARFKKMHEQSFVKNNRICAKLSHNINFEGFLKKFVQKEKKIIKSMSIKKISLLR
ncbi:hypothetical protein GOV14_04550 [Candidatus Pacearchaeota archaeon]|nr:hypothetical protein [Candidatus Pacearchaeota archaeon]